MRTWLRLESPAYCGKCGNEIPSGQPVLALTSEKFKRAFYRCADCEGPAPPDLPPLVEKFQTTKRMTQVGKAKPEWMPYRD